MWTAVTAVAVGGALGALSRWQLGLRLNALLPSIPPGTLAANLIGGFIIGLAIAGFSQMPGVPEEWQLFVITGFCGGLTTFSTFSAEVVALVQSNRLATAAGTILAHVGGSLVMTVLGMASWQWIRSR
jgi:fluoride exporter